MKLNEKATKEARRRHAAGVKRLNSFFRVTKAALMAFTDAQTGRPTPVRLRPNVPPLRPDRAYRLRRKLRKTRHESRRRNR